MKLQTRLITYLKRFAALIFLLSFISLLVIFNAKHIQPSGLQPVVIDKKYVLDNVHLVMVEEQTVLNNQQLVINRGVIESINPAGSIAPLSYEVIDGNNAYVTPGLFDMHVHHLERKALTLSLAHGVTSVRMMRGYRMQRVWREELKNQEWLGSNLYLSSPIFASRNTHMLNQPVISPEHARQLVNKVHEDGFDLIKLYGYLDAPEFEAIIERANELGMPVAKHGPHPAKNSDWKYIKGLQSLEHVEDIYQGPLNYQFDHNALKETVAQIKSTQVPVTPTLAIFDHLSKLSAEKQAFIDQLSLEYLNPVRVSLEKEHAIARWLADTKKQSAFHIKKGQFLSDIVKELHLQKVKLLVGSDSGMMYMAAGLSTHAEMALLKQAGLSDFEVIQAATINPAEALKIGNRYGSIKVGKVADLVVTQLDPTTNITVLKNPAAVIKNGQWISETQLSNMKQSAKEHPAFVLTWLLLIEDIVTRYFCL